MILPSGFVEHVRQQETVASGHDAKARAIRLDYLCEFRDEVMPSIHHNDLMQAYAELGQAMNRDAETARQGVGMIRMYPFTQLLEWSDAGLTFAHIRAANKLAETPARLLDDAIRLGSGTGDRPMTVTEMTAYYLGRQDVKPPTVNYWVERVTKSISGLVSKWSDKQREAFKVKLVKLIDDVNEL